MKTAKNKTYKLCSMYKKQIQRKRERKEERDRVMNKTNFIENLNNLFVELE